MWVPAKLLFLALTLGALVILTACNRTQVKPGLFDNERAATLDGTYRLESVATGCSGPIDQEVRFALLKPVEDGVTVAVETVAVPEGRDHIIFTYTFTNGMTATRRVDIGMEYKWVNEALWWTPILRQHFPYVLGVDRTWLKGEVRRDSETLHILQERSNMKGGLLAFPGYSTVRRECRFVRISGD